VPGVTGKDFGQFQQPRRQVGRVQVNVELAKARRPVSIQRAVPRCPNAVQRSLAHAPPRQAAPVNDRADGSPQLDTRATTTASRVHLGLEPVEAVNRPTHAEGKGYHIASRLEGGTREPLPEPARLLEVERDTLKG